MDPLASPDFYAELRDLQRRLDFLERAPRYASQVVTAVPTGVLRDFGYVTGDTTSYLDMFRADVPLTAPLLDYDVQLTSAWATSTPTSIQWRIQAFTEDGTPFTAASGSGSDGSQFAGVVDLIPLLGPGALGTVVRFNLETKRTGGSGDVGIRQVRPMYLRPPAA